MKGGETMDADRMMEKMREYGADVPGALARFLGDRELYCSCLESFMDDENFALLEESLRQENARQAFEAAHTLKGVAGNLSLTPLYKALCVLVEPLRGGECSEVSAEYAQVAQQYERLKKAFSEAL